MEVNRERDIVMKLRWLFFILCYLLPSGLYAHEALDRFFRNLDSLQAYFVQKLYSENGRLMETSLGRMQMQRPNKFRWNYQHPYGQLIVADGKSVWIYDSDLEQVTLKNLDKALGKTPAFLLSSNRSIEADYYVNQLSSKVGKRFELIPKDAQAQFDSMQIHLSEKTLLGLELIDNLGQKTFITFSQVKRNPRLAQELFIFTPPAGVDIITDGD